ncbi:hypothetical protein GCM10008025_21240 [Ornithinibacillus halotolerans]|uniref:Uncharacterized protein n=1 Tax=Ornithinibacillus halotolerans TaxID=1274357 RepID=A0A916RZ64_9BACI|nr:hypothetical protein GCM10008025_21240 [Ornithinibacillus halotolerans]
MNSRPICGDVRYMHTYYYCAYEYGCDLRGFKAKYRKRVDFLGDVCENKAIACPC